MVPEYKYKFDNFGLILTLVSGLVLINFMDPINWPKQISLLCIVPIALNHLRISMTAIKHYPLAKTLMMVFGISIALVLIASVSSFLFRDVSMTRTLWGLWGRNNGLLTAFALFIVSAAISLLVLQRDYVERFFRSMEVGSIVFVFYGVLQLLGADPVKWSKQGEVFSFFGNTNFASAVFSLSASTFLILALFDKSPIFLRILRVALFFLTVYLLTETKSIQGIAALTITGLLLAYVKIGFKKKYKQTSFFAFSALLGSTLFFGTLGYGPLGSLIAQYTLQLRYQYWLVGLKIGNLSPIWGVGMDSYGDYFRTERPEELALKTSIDLTTNNAHNVFVQAYATMGILGFLAILIPVGLGVFFSIKTLLSDDPSNFEKCVGILFISLWSIAFFSIDNIAIAVWNYSFLGLVFGVFIKLRMKIDSVQVVMSKKKSTVDGKRYIALALAAILFAFSWYASFPDRKIQSYLANPVNPNDSNSVQIRSEEMVRLSSSSFIMETQLWNLASELNKMNVATELFSVLKIANEKYPVDFNILDLNAGYREQRGLAVEAIPFREKQLEIEPRHPRIWLSYAYDLKAAGRVKEASSAFAKVKEYEEFLSQEIKAQLGTIEGEFVTPKQ